MLFIQLRRDKIKQGVDGGREEQGSRARPLGYTRVGSPSHGSRVVTAELGGDLDLTKVWQIRLRKEGQGSGYNY